MLCTVVPGGSVWTEIEFEDHIFVLVNVSYVHIRHEVIARLQCRRTGFLPGKRGVR